MDKIDYSWSKTELHNATHGEVEDDNPDELPSRHDLQLTRRFFHFISGALIATAYLIFLSHQQMIHFLGAIACFIYVIEQVRISYPEFAQKVVPVTRFVLRAEEQLKESAMVPFMISVLLTIITFPKIIAIIAIFILATSDPLSAIIGIRFGKTKIVGNKSLEGSLAFFVSAFLICHGILMLTMGAYTWEITFASILLAFFSAAFEVLPLKLDDNLTIPLSTSAILWPISEMLALGL